jgi:signal transduction histidine kinase
MEDLEKMKRRPGRDTDMFPSLHSEISTRFRYAERRFERVLIAGFSLVLLLMLASAAVAITEMRRLEQGTEQMSGRYLAQARLVEELERQQGAIGILLYNMGDVSGPAAAQVYRREAGLRRQAVRSLVADSARSGLPAPEVQAWAAIGAATQALFDEIDLLLSQGRGNSPALSERLSAFMAQSTRVIDLSYSDVSRDREEELDKDSGIIRGSTTVMAGALSLAILCAVLCVVGAITGFRGIEKQAEALGRLSVHTFAEQEESARRFSQEMHDEFGQTLNAIESTLTAVEAKNPAHQERVLDAVALAKEAQALARDMSQLMRPRILDDFGLDAGLRELAQGFSRRSGISVDYRGDFRDRLDPAVETHLFRIAQEALTNSARHSDASNIELSLLREKSRGGPLLRLRIADNGGGLKKEASGSGLGMLGMRERARAAGGVLSITEVSHDFRQGVEIAVQVPLPQSTGTEAAA